MIQILVITGKSAGSAVSVGSADEAAVGAQADKNTKERISNIANKTNINLIRIVAPSFLSARQRVALFNKIGCARDGYTEDCPAFFLNGKINRANAILHRPASHD